MKKLSILLCALVAMTACSTKQNNADTTSTKSLIVYYSQTHATEQVAKTLQNMIGADIEAISAVMPYDGDFQQTIARCQEEMSANILPELNPMQKNIADYDTIYLGYPVWFGTFAQPMAALIGMNDFAGKVVIPFCTFGSGGLNTTSDQLKEKLQNATILPGYGVRNARIAAAETEVRQFLINSGIIAGEKVSLPEFGESQEITEETKKIFDAACGSYQMPLGTPVTFSSRSIENGTEYLFNVEMNGTASGRIYVTAMDGAEPEFTQVER
ncbi:MAG: hypothetical protein KBT20_03765 [Bacteroidales bacterium]|nr:hypothetical protein [Candidatus Liminaster caballi]